MPCEPHDIDVNMVVERGLARCPKCVSVADYVFIESVSAGVSSAMRYEVRCRKCGECYGEDSRPSAPAPVAEAESLIEWPPDREPIPARDWRAEVRDWRTEVRGKLSVAPQRTAPVVEEMVRRTHVSSLKRWFGRKGEEDGGQTGG